jgi:hypothetical protein
MSEISFDSDVCYKNDEGKRGSWRARGEVEVKVEKRGNHL